METKGARRAAGLAENWSAPMDLVLTDRVAEHRGDDGQARL
jgi:hypothetical protein